MVDRWIQDSQSWLDTWFYGEPGYVPTPQDGRTGWPTMYSLTRALQISLGIGTPSNTFGAGTTAAFNAQIGTLGPAVATSHPKVIGILRAALWCKGYSGGYNAVPGSAAFLQWDADLDATIVQLRSDLGLSAGGVNSKLMKSLLSMDAYKQVPGGVAPVRVVQQWMNGRYFGRRDFPMVPCDGIFSRQVQVGLMYSVQYEIGMADGVANGNFGPGTRQGLRTYGDIAIGAVDGTRKMVSLFQAALIFNGHLSTPFGGTFNVATQAQMQAFQGFAELALTSGANYSTWASLLISTGDPDRPVTAADTSSIVDAPRATTLTVAGHTTIGRYINGTGEKRLSHIEPAVFQSNGMHWFPIYQEWNRAPSHFSRQQGYVQGLRIAARARVLGLPPGSLIFLAVDYDATGDEITAIIRPHFEGAREALSGVPSLPLKLGIYGTRNVCTRIAAMGLTEGSFVSDMSSGWSGNLGFRLPPDWMYDQIKEHTIGSGSGQISIDRVARSSRAMSLAGDALERTPRRFAGDDIVGYDESIWWVWGQLATLAEVAYDSGPLSEAYGVLYEAYRHHYGNQAVDRPDSPANMAFHVFFSPPPADIGYEILLASYSEMFGIPSDGVFGFTKAAGADFALGDIPHAAVVASTYLNLDETGTLDTSQASLSDYAAWAGDLMGVWANYEAARLSAGGSLDAYTWLRSRIGTSINVHNGLAIHDFRADAFGFVLWRELVSAGEPFAIVMRRIQVSINDDPTWLAKRFYALRFGGSYAKARAAAAHAVSSGLALNTLIRELFDDERPPGSTRSAATDPPANVRATEVDACARAFADALLDATASWNLRS